MKWTSKTKTETQKLHATKEGYRSNQGYQKINQSIVSSLPAVELHNDWGL